MNDILNYIPERGYEEFPKDETAYMEEIVATNTQNIIKANVTLPDVITAIPTIYNEDGSINYIELDKMLENQSNSGIKAVLIAGTTGESSFLDHSEQIEYVRVACNLAKKYGLKILAGSGSNSTKEQNSLTSGIFQSGADASLLLAPYYIKASDTDIVRHLTEGLNYGPAIIYSIGGRTGIPISTEVLEILSKHPNFLGVKECDGSEKISALTKKGIRVWTGNDDLSIGDVHKEGACGMISVVSNIDPELILEVRNGINLTRAKIDRLMDLSHLMFLPRQPNPKPIHNAIEMIRRSTDKILNSKATFRLPGGPLSIQQQEYMARGLKELGIKAVPFYDNFKLIK